MKEYLEMLFWKTVCFFDGHIWSSEDIQKQKKYRLNGGWESIGGFPEQEERKCLRCDKREER